MNPILAQTRIAIRQAAVPELHTAIDEIVRVATQEIRSSPHATTLGCSSKQKAERIAADVARLLSVLFIERKALPQVLATPPVVVPATVILKVTPAFLALCTKALGSKVFQLFGVTGERIQIEARARVGVKDQQLQLRRARNTLGRYVVSCMPRRASQGDAMTRNPKPGE
jgi:hypothetical protein